MEVCFNAAFCPCDLFSQPCKASTDTVLCGRLHLHGEVCKCSFIIIQSLAGFGQLFVAFFHSNARIANIYYSGTNWSNSP